VIKLITLTMFLYFQPLHLLLSQLWGYGWLTCLPYRKLLCRRKMIR